MPSNPPPNMLPGYRYRFVYRSDAQRKDHYSVLKFLGTDDENYVLDARPYAGTQRLPKRWVRHIYLANGEPLTIDGRVLK